MAMMKPERWRALMAIVIAATASTPLLAQLVTVQLSYPPAALRAGQEGTVEYEVRISKDGRVTSCRVTQTSGAAILDRETCAQLRQSAHFKPAINTDGKAVASTFTGRLTWSIPRPRATTTPAASAASTQSE